MTGELYINNKDAWSTFGVCLDEGNEDSLLLLASIKGFASNNMASQHGRQVCIDNVRVDERELSLMFCFAWQSDYITKYDLFVDELQKGNMELKIPSLKRGFKLVYVSCRNYSSIKYAGKIHVNFTEPNPKDRLMF